MGLFSSLFGGNKKQYESNAIPKSSEPVVDKKKIEKMVSLAEDSLLMRGANSSINVETSVFAYAGKAYLSHQMILTVNKKIPVSFDIEGTIGMIRNGASETESMRAVEKLKEFLEVNGGQEASQRLYKYIKTVEFRDVNLMQLVATYNENVDAEYLAMYKNEIFKKIKEKLVRWSNVIKETGDTLEIDILFKGFK